MLMPETSCHLQQRLGALKNNGCLLHRTLMGVNFLRHRLVSVHRRQSVYPELGPIGPTKMAGWAGTVAPSVR